jgi:hypothetical protein
MRRAAIRLATAYTFLAAANAARYGLKERVTRSRRSARAAINPK